MRPPPIATRTDTLIPYTELFRSRRRRVTGRICPAPRDDRLPVLRGHQGRPRRRIYRSSARTFRRALCGRERRLSGAPRAGLLDRDETRDADRLRLAAIVERAARAGLTRPAGNPDTPQHSSNARGRYTSYHN